MGLRQRKCRAPEATPWCGRPGSARPSREGAQAPELLRAWKSQFACAWAQGRWTLSRRWGAHPPRGLRTGVSWRLSPFCWKAGRQCQGSLARRKWGRKQMAVPWRQWKGALVQQRRQRRRWPSWAQGRGPEVAGAEAGAGAVAVAVAVVAAVTAAAPGSAGSASASHGRSGSCGPECTCRA